MPIFKEIPPTGGWKFCIKDFFKEPASLTLEEDFRSYLGTNDVYITYSGTAALYIIFEALKKISSKRTVIIPSYVCPLVALAAQRAGLRIKVCDVNRDNFDFNYTNLEALCSADSDILAVIAVHLGGIPLDFDRIKNITDKYKIFTVEDCAHALGSEYKGRKCATLGDFSFFSLCRGKGLTIYEGGVLSVNKKEYAGFVTDTIKEVVRRNYLSEAVKIFELFGYWIFYRPELFWFVFKLPQSFWNFGNNKNRAFGEDYDTGFDTHAVSGFRKFLGHKSFYRLESEIASQREKAAFYIKALNEISGVKALQEASGTLSVYPFLVLLFDDPKKRNEFLAKAEKYGLGVSIVYLNAISDYDYLKGSLICACADNARYISERQVTLSTSKFLKEKDAQLLLGLAKETLAS